MRPNTNKQQRQTKQKESILYILRNTRSHPTADIIYEELRKQIPNISKGTVYRNLKLLIESGLVSDINLNDTISKYEIKQQTHYHLRCEKCNKVSDIEIPVDKYLNKRVAQKTGLKISSHQLEFRGICINCQHKD